MCSRPPEGWHCLLPEDHDGPCPAWPDGAHEWGIRLLRRPEEPHRTGMTLMEACEWMDGWLEDGGNEGVFALIRREIGPWEQVGYLVVDDGVSG